MPSILSLQHRAQHARMCSLCPSKCVVDPRCTMVQQGHACMIIYMSCRMQPTACAVLRTCSVQLLCTAQTPAAGVYPTHTCRVLHDDTKQASGARPPKWAAKGALLLFPCLHRCLTPLFNRSNKGGLFDRFATLLCSISACAPQKP